MRGLQSEGLDDRAVRAVLEDVLARPEFDDEPSQLEDFLRRLELPEFEGLGLPGWLGPLLVGLLVALLVWKFVRRAKTPDEPGESEQAGPMTPAERVRDLLERARVARTEGDLRLALRLFFFALVIGLSNRGDLRYRDAWTWRELLARGRPGTRVKGLLAELVTELEAKEFGRAPTSAADVERLESLCRQHLGSLALVRREAEVAP